MPAGRSAADILREAGIDSTGRGGRRRRAEPDEEVREAPGPEPAPREVDETAPVPTIGRRRRAEPDAEPPPPAPPALDPPTPALPALDPPTPAPPAPPTPARPTPREIPDLGGPAAPRGTEIPDLAVQADSRGERTARASTARTALGWLLFLVELVVAAVLGVLIWYAFSLLWELYPYVAALAAPFVLTGIVIGGRIVRVRSGRRLGLSTLVTLLLVGSLLVVLPAAAVLSGT